MAQKLCTACGSVGYTKNVMKGSMLTELFLWLFFLLPGLIYSIWRHTTRADVCSKCGSPTVIPVDSPIAKRYLDTPEPGPQLVSNRTPRPVTKTPVKQKLIIAGAICALFLFTIISINSRGPSTAAATSAPTPAAAVDTDHVVDEVLASSASRYKRAEKIEKKGGSRDAFTASVALDQSANQILRVEASGFADHNMDLAISLDRQKKDLRAQLTNWNVMYGEAAKQ